MGGGGGKEVEMGEKLEGRGKGGGIPGKKERGDERKFLGGRDGGETWNRRN